MEEEKECVCYMKSFMGEFQDRGHLWSLHGELHGSASRGPSYDGRIYGEKYGEFEDVVV